MAERKIFNFKSEVLIEETIKREGYHPDTLGKSSSKFIWAICRFCGEPSKIRKGFFNKAGSACHNTKEKPCRLKEQSISGSPFARDDVKEKARQTNLERYGTEHACQNQEVAKRLSEGRKKAQPQIEKTNLVKYGVENPFQSEAIKEEIRLTNIKKYGTSHAMQNKVVKEKTKATLKEKYGVDNISQIPGSQEKREATNLERYGFTSPMMNPDIQRSKTENWKKTIAEDPNENYTLINTLRGDEFWEKMKTDITLAELCDLFSLNYQSVTSRLLTDEFRDRYYELYSFPRQQEQKRLCGLINDLGFVTSFNDRSIIPPLELDIVVPDIKVAIEFNGCYWHSEACLDSSVAKHKHLEKTRKCQNVGYRLFQIFEHQWKERESQTMNFIKSILGLHTRRVFARNCTLTNTECKDFIEANHIQGYGNRTIKYFNLEIDGEIIGSMTASSHHRQNGDANAIVLNRLCFADGVQIVGGASKLFSHFKQWAKEQGYANVLSWSDNLWTEGDIYRKMGFILEQEYSPGYFYWDVKKHIAFSKQSQQKNKVGCPANLSENKWCESRNLFRIWDCGKRKWMFRL